MFARTSPGSCATSPGSIHSPFNVFLKGNAIKAVIMSWSKVLNKPFILMQVLSESAQI